ncbi:hypothetical protein U1Q18_013491 [Sarracenia purpurea var. burkii]
MVPSSSLRCRSSSEMETPCRKPFRRKPPATTPSAPEKSPEIIALFFYSASYLRSKKTTVPPLPETPLPELFAPLSYLIVAPATPMEISTGPANLRTQKSPPEYLVVAQLVAPPQIYRQRRKPRFGMLSHCFVFLLLRNHPCNF